MPTPAGRITATRDIVAECQAQGASVAGVALLKRGFSDETVGGLLLSALGPTAVAAGAFLFL